MIERSCLCDDLPRIRTQTRLIIVGHVFELARPTNTARLAALMLPDLTVVERGGPDRRPAEWTTGPNAADAWTRTHLLYPTPTATELTPAWAHLDPRPITLVIADGSWPQAKRAVRREPALASLPHLRLPPGPPTRFWLRDLTRTADHLSTLEAIARALGIIEGHYVEAQLLSAFDLFVERTLGTRGRLSGPQALSRPAKR